jgi:glyoxylase-like metal-dependent hydrolase (beta-lactamase superfamily II)
MTILIDQLLIKYEEKMFTKTLALTALLTTSIISSSSLFAKKEVKITSTKLTNTIYMLSAKGGNVGVFIGADGTFIIDDQFAPMSEKLLAKIKSLGGESPKFLINTHFHGDHTGGNENFGKKGAMIIAHKNVRSHLQEGSLVKTFNMVTPPAPAAALPVITYTEKMYFHLNKDDISIIHTPKAHTDGDSFIYFKQANVVHAGDIFFNGFYPFIDPDNGGSLKGMIAAVDTLLAITDANSKIIPGHGPLADKKQLEAYSTMLKTAYKNLLALKNTGTSLADAKTSQPLKTLDEKWGKGMFTSDKWIDIIYPSITK